MITEKIFELDQLIIPTGQMTKIEATRVMKKTKNNSEAWITLGKKM